MLGFQRVGDGYVSLYSDHRKYYDRSSVADIPNIVVDLAQYLKGKAKSNKLLHSIFNKIASILSDDFEEPAHPHSLIRVFARHCG